MAKIGVVYLDVKPDMSGFGREVQTGVHAQVGGAKGTSLMGGLGAGMGKALGLGVAAGFTAAGAAGIIGLNVAKDMEQVEIAFRTTLGERAPQFIEDLKDFAAKTPFEFAGLAQSAAKLTAVGVEANRVIPIMTTLGDATSAMGTGAEGIDRAVRALTQMEQKGKVTAEEMMQLTEAGIPAWDALAAVLDTDVAGAMAQVTEGTVTAADMFKALETGAGESLGKLSGMMEQQSMSLEGMISTLKDTVMMGLADLMTPLLPVIKEGIGHVSDLFGALIPALSPVIEALVDGLGTAIGALVPIIEQALPPFMEFVAILGETLFDALAAILPVLGQLLAALTPLLPPIALLVQSVVGALVPVIVQLAQALTPVIAQLVEALVPVIERLTPLIADVALAMADVLISLIPLIPVLVELVIALLPLIEAFITTQLTVAKLWFTLEALLVRGIVAVVVPAIKGLVAAVNWLLKPLADVLSGTRTLGEAWDGIWGGIKEITATVVSFIDGIWDSLVSTIRSTASTLFSPLKRSAEAVVDGIKAAWTKIVDGVKALPRQIAAAARGMWDGIVDAFRDAINVIIDLWNAIDLGFTIPSWIPGIGGAGVKDLFPDIPRLAEGGVVSTPTLAFLGEVSRARPEVVAPEALLRHIVRQEAGGRDGVGDLYAELIVDGERVAPVVGRLLRRHDNQLARQLRGGYR